MNHVRSERTDRSGSPTFSASDFARVRLLIHRHAGIALPPTRDTMVSNRLGRRVRELGLASFGAYLDLVESGHASECQIFTNALTTNLTAFFREAHHFPILANHLARVAENRVADVWCAAASTGEEAYSIAITACETLGSRASRVNVLASDVDTDVLATASEGIYDAARVAALDPDRLRRFFQKGVGAREGYVRVGDTVRKRVLFRHINLLESNWPLGPGYDVIFCRNVLIYFDRPTQQSLLTRFAQLLRPGGLLFTGHAESLHEAQHLYRLRGKSVYELTNEVECIGTP